MAENNTPGRERLEMEISGSLAARFTAYAERHGISKAEGLARSANFLFEVDQALDDGFTVGARGTINGVEVEREFILRHRPKPAPAPTI